MKKALWLGLVFGISSATACNERSEGRGPEDESSLNGAPNPGTGGAGALGDTGVNTISDVPPRDEGLDTVGKGPGTGAGVGTGATTPILPGTTPEGSTVPSGTGTEMDREGATRAGPRVTGEDAAPKTR